LVSFSITPEISKTARRHTSAVLFITWIVYAYRDIYPLLTFDEIPKDDPKNGILWAKITLLTLSGVFIPLIIPRCYIPVDPSNPSDPPSPEQTASWLSIALYSFLDRTVREASKASHLSFDKLPPLVDSDEAENLRKRSFKHLDVFSDAKKRNLFFGLMRVFWRQYAAMVVLIVILTAGELVAPIGMYNLLK
jgi:hypothetical protein